LGGGNITISNPVAHQGRFSVPILREGRLGAIEYNEGFQLEYTKKIRDQSPVPRHAR